MSFKALFLDRDGVINVEKNYLYKIEEFEFIDGVFETCLAFQNNDYKLVIVTNQAGIARGIYSEEDFSRLTQWMLNQFLIKGVRIDAVYHCPHHPEYSRFCECRKPRPGMIFDAAKALDLNLSESILVGDKMTDVHAGIAAGIGKNYIVTTGHCEPESEHYPYKIRNLKELIDVVY